MSAEKRSTPESPEPENRPARLLGLGRLNFVILAAAFVVIAFGYVLLSRGSITAAPILLVVGYVVLIPAALLMGYRRLRR
jgi:hypothetical protein